MTKKKRKCLNSFITYYIRNFVFCRKQCCDNRASTSQPSPALAPTSTATDPSQHANFSPPITSPSANASSSNSTKQPDPFSGQYGSPPKASSAPSPLNNASPPPPPPPFPPPFLAPNDPPSSPVATPMESNPAFFPPQSLSTPSPDSKATSPPAAPVLSAPSTQELPHSSPPIQVVIPVTPVTPSVPPPPNSAIPITISPPILSTPDAPLSPSIPVKPNPSTSSGGEAPIIAPQGNSISTYRGYSANVPSSSHVSPSNGVVIAATVGGAVIAFIALVLVILVKRKRRMNDLKKQYRSTPNISSKGTGKMSYGSNGGYGYLAGAADSAKTRPWFSYEELTGITNGFSYENKIGEGGFGSVFRGSLPDGRTVAIKQVKIGSGQGKKEFRAEIEIISRIHHLHLVSLVGYCISEDHRLLLYEFVPKKTLEHHLHGKDQLTLNWQKKIKNCFRFCQRISVFA